MTLASDKQITTKGIFFKLNVSVGLNCILFSIEQGTKLVLSQDINYHNNL